MLHHLLSTGFSDTSWLGLILSQQAHHRPYCQRKFHFSPSLMGDYCNVKPLDLNNTSGFYYEKKGLYFGVFFLQRSPDTKPWITWNNGLQWSARPPFFRKKTTCLKTRTQWSNYVSETVPGSQNSHWLGKPEKGRDLAYPWMAPDSSTATSSPGLLGSDPFPKALAPTDWTDSPTPMLISRERFPRGLKAHRRIISPGNTGRKQLGPEGEHLRATIS